MPVFGWIAFEIFFFFTFPPYFRTLDIVSMHLMLFMTLSLPFPLALPVFCAVVLIAT